MYVDLHLHLLPGVDDGVRDLEEALGMARLLVEQGYRQAAVTPHIRPGLFDNTAAPLRHSLEVLEAALKAAEIPLELSIGAEHFLCPEVVEMLLDQKGLPLGHGRYALLEAPVTGPVPSLEQIVFRLEVGGVTPVFAHPERCECFQALEVVRTLREKGAHFQLDLGSLAGAYGWSARRTARKILDAGLYSVAGTDLHRLEQGQKLLGKWISALTDRVDAPGATRLLSTHPRRVLAGEALP